MNLVPRLDSFVDERGEIRDLLRNVKLDSVTLITTKKGAVRGNHFHQYTTQFLLVLYGAMRVVTKEPGEPVQEAIYRTGDLFMDPPRQRHAWQALMTTGILVMTSGPRSGPGYESDTFRLSEAERLIR